MKFSTKSIILGSLLLIGPIIAHAAVYKHVDSEGRLIKYSDQPQKPGDKPVTMSKPAMVYESEKPVKKPSSKPKDTRKKQLKEQSKPVVAYVAVAIIKPDHEEAIRANSGSFPIEIASQPPLDSKSGHRYVIVVDGEKHGQSNLANFTLENMSRGAHSIKVEIQDKAGTVLVSSSSKTIYVLRASRR